MERIYLNDDWLFAESYDASLLDREMEEAKLQKVRLPHTVRELPFHYFDESLYQMECGYRRHLWVPESWKGKRLLLTIDGACHSAYVSVNGKAVGEHHCGYTAFTMDITDAVCFEADNILTVRLDSRENQNLPPFGFVVDYMTYGGLTREVTLEVKEEAYIEDLFAKPSVIEVRGERGLCRLYSEVQVQTGELRNLTLKQTLSTENETALLISEEVMESSMTLTSEDKELMLWDIDHPALYWLETELVHNGTVIDRRRDRIGFRRSEFKTDGYYLNDRKVKIRGLNRHQSYPYVGYAMPESMQRLDADILKRELACNAVRTSHYPQSHHFIDRCDELGLLVFTEFPGWQHIGDEAWKMQAVVNEREMITQYRNHTSIILWGVRINESQDDEAFYKKTNAVAHELDDTRPTGGVRAHKKSQFFEDVYTYNDFVHDAKARGCEPKKKVATDLSKPYLVSEYNGHMYPTKAFDWEEHRVEHALRHANVLDAIAAEQDIAGSFGWCMFDYNTHKDFGSGDRICYHGVMDMFRNPKLAALIYACEEEKGDILELSSTMDIGEHPGCNRGYTYILSNADSVRMYKNDVFIKEYTRADSPYRNLKHGPMIIDDFIGNQIYEKESFRKDQCRILTEGLNYTATHGYGKYPLRILLGMAKCMIFYGMKPTDAVRMYNKYIGDWGGTSTVYRFEAIKNGKVVKTIVKEPMHKLHLSYTISTDQLEEKNTYDVAEIRLKACDENENQMYYYNDPITITTQGPIEVIGPKTTALRGGMTGIYLRTTGEHGDALVQIKNEQAGELTIPIKVL